MSLRRGLLACVPLLLAGCLASVGSAGDAKDAPDRLARDLGPDGRVRLETATFEVTAAFPGNLSAEPLVMRIERSVERFQGDGYLATVTSDGPPLPGRPLRVLCTPEQLVVEGMPMPNVAGTCLGAPQEGMPEAWHGLPPDRVEVMRMLDGLEAPALVHAGGSKGAPRYTGAWELGLGGLHLAFDSVWTAKLQDGRITRFDVAGEGELPVAPGVDPAAVRVTGTITYQYGARGPSPDPMQAMMPPEAAP